MRRRVPIVILVLSFIVAVAAPALAGSGVATLRSARETQEPGGVPQIFGHGIRPVIPKQPDPDFEVPRPGVGPRAPAAGPQVKLSTGGGFPVLGWDLSADGTTVVWVEETLAGTNVLLSRPVDASAPFTVLAGAGVSGVTAFAITPDSSAVVFLWDGTIATTTLESVPIGGGAITTLAGTGPEGPIASFLIGPASSTVAFQAADTLAALGTLEVFTVPTGGGPYTQVSNVGVVFGTSTLNGFLDWSDSGSHVGYASDISGGGGYFGGFVAGAGLSASGIHIGGFAGAGSVTGITWLLMGPGFVVTASDDAGNGVQDVYTTLLDGTLATAINPPPAGGASGVSDMELDPTGGRVRYVTDQDTAGIAEPFVAPIFSPNSGAGVHTFPLGGGQTNISSNFTGDGSQILYNSDELIPGDIELFARPSNLGGPSVLLVDVPDGSTDIVGFFTNLGIPVVNRRGVYPYFPAVGAVNLFSVATDGTEAPIQLNDPPAASDSLFIGVIPINQGARLMGYGVGPTSTGVVDKLYAVPIRRDFLPELVNAVGASSPGGIGNTQNFLINAPETHAVWDQDFDTAGLTELYSAPLDTDGDGAINGADNCKYKPNPAQGLVPFGPTVLAPDRTTWSWGVRDEVKYAAGPLPPPGGPLPPPTATGSVLDATQLEDPSVPGAGTGTWILLAPDCTGSDWDGAGRNALLN